MAVPVSFQTIDTQEELQRGGGSKREEIVSMYVN